MTTMTTAPTIEFPRARVALAVLALPAILGVIGAGVTAIGGGGIASVLMPSLSVAIAGVVSVLFLTALGARPVTTAPMSFVAISILRLAMATGVAIAVYLLGVYDARVYWIVFLVIGMTTLIAETLVAMQAVREELHG